MRGTKTIELKLRMRCTQCAHVYSFIVERDKQLIHEGTKCPKCKSLGVPFKDQPTD